VAFNHVNFLEIPILVAYSYPLKVTGLAKSETWKNPLFAFLFNSYRAIPIERGRAFAGAFRRVREAMDDGFFMCVAPEGTRSGDGILGEGKPGIIKLAMEAGAPILPVAHHGGERIWENIRKFKRTDFNLRVGRPFRIRFDGSPGKLERAEILAEIMGRMADLLPEHMRGAHAARAGRECRHLDFLP
jgi:1-acyl-sn-glycerol-3-phosphate acyltransferase